MCKKWGSAIPTKCQLCNKPITTVFIDGVTEMGSWAIMCPECHARECVGLGIGKGQRFEKQGEDFIKTK